MKISKVPGFGSFGVYVDDFEYDSIEAWKELRELNLKTLVTVVRGNGIDRFNEIFRYIPFVGRFRGPSYKYDKDGKLTVEQNQDTFKTRSRWKIPVPGTDSYYPIWHRISGARDENNNSIGIFGDTELLWHSAESGRYEFAPLVALYGNKSMRKSATGFIQFTDWFRKQSQAFQSELREMRVIHGWKPYSIEPNATEEEEAVMREAFTDHVRGQVIMPLVIHSPGGIEGLHYSGSTILGFDGMTRQESDALVARLDKELYVDEYRFDYWWENDTGDLLLFDNSIVLHNRSTDPDEDMTQLLRTREGFRAPLDYADMENYDPFMGQDPYSSLRREDMNLTNAVTNIPHCQYILRVLETLTSDEKKQYISQLPKTYRTGLALAAKEKIGLDSGY